jgi:hypothetical protein
VDDEAEAHVVASAYRVQESLIGGDDDAQALQRVAAGATPDEVICAGSGGGSVAGSWMCLCPAGRG